MERLILLEEIKGYVKENGRRISDAILSIMTLTDKVDDVKEDVRDISEIIKDMQEDIGTMIELNKRQMEINTEMRESNNEIKGLIDQMILLHKEMRRDIDSMLDKDREVWGNRKVGVM